MNCQNAAGGMAEVFSMFMVPLVRKILVIKILPKLLKMKFQTLFLDEARLQSTHGC